MELTLQTFLIVCPLVFLGGFVDSVAGGAGIITIPAYLMAGIPVHLAAGTNKLVNGSGTLVATLKYIKSGKVVKDEQVAALCNAMFRCVDDKYFFPLEEVPAKKTKVKKEDAE